MTSSEGQEIRIPVEGGLLAADLSIPPEARGLVLFAHGSGSSRHSSRNRFVAKTLNQAAFATLLADLLTAEEDHIDAVTRQYRFDIPLLATRLQTATASMREQSIFRELPFGYFGASTGAAAALIAAAETPSMGAVVSRGGRPDLAGEALPKVQAPTLLIVGGLDTEVIRLNEEAFRHLGSAEKRIEIVPGATHLFEEPGKLEIVADIAADWFSKHLV